MIQPMPKEVEEIAEKHLGNQPFGGIITIKEEPILANLIPTCINYRGKKWGAIRRRIDHLDQVTFCRLKER